MKPIITTNRLELRKPEQYMSSDIYELTIKNYNDFNLFLPWVRNISSEKDTKNMIKAYKKLFLNNQEYRFYIFENKNHNLIGSITLRNIDALSKQAELGFWLDKDQVGKGYIVESFNAIIKELDAIETIIANTSIGNCRCIRTLQRLGFDKLEEHTTYISFSMRVI